MKVAVSTTGGRDGDVMRLDRGLRDELTAFFARYTLFLVLLHCAVAHPFGAKTKLDAKNRYRLRKEIEQPPDEYKSRPPSVLDLS